MGAGGRFDTAMALQQANPGARWIVSDTDERVLLAPPRLEAVLLDVTHPRMELLAGVDFVYAVRLPEELQLPAARLAHALGADLALRPLKDEWADVSGIFRQHAVWSDGWRHFARIE